MMNLSDFHRDVKGLIFAMRKTCMDLLDAFSIGGFSKTKREQYDKDMYDEKRRNGELAAAREDGIAEGLAQGHA